jgi:hypothetical protein
VRRAGALDERLRRRIVPASDLLPKALSFDRHGAMLPVEAEGGRRRSFPQHREM